MPSPVPVSLDVLTVTPKSSTFCTSVDEPVEESSIGTPYPCIGGPFGDPCIGGTVGLLILRSLGEYPTYSDPGTS